jgi:acyl-CoA synthetase (AMP-forming)/AMP-acid ligase II
LRLHTLKGAGVQVKSSAATKWEDRGGAIDKGELIMVIVGPYPPVEIPDTPLTDYVLEFATEFGDKPALIDGPTGRTISYSNLIGRVQALAAGLSAHGFAKGDCFAIYMPNLPEYAVAFHGVVSVGGLVTTVNPLYTPDELAFQLEDSKARFLLTIPQFLDSAKEAAGKTGVEEVFVLGDAEGATSVSELFSTSTEAPPVDIDVHADLAVLPYSSGTTGFPKGVMLTHHNLVSNISQFHGAHPIDSSDVFIGLLPFFHIYGMTVLMNGGLRKGATIVTIPRFDLEAFLELSERYRTTRAYLVPPVILALAKHPVVANYDLSSLEIIMSGAAPLSGDLASAAAERLGCHVMQGYGLTETSPVTHCVPVDPARNKPGSIGPPIPNTECRVVDVTTGEEAATDELGEVWIRGPQIMTGYLNNDAATSMTIDSEGWLHSGDIGRVDSDGYFFLVDRLKELIKYKGMQVAPAELEALLLTHPQISDAAVIGVPDEEAGEVPKAFVVIAGEVSKDDIKSYVAERVSPHKRVRYVEVVEAIPKSASGKILRRMLKDEEVPAR